MIWSFQNKSVCGSTKGRNPFRYTGQSSLLIRRLPCCLNCDLRDSEVPSDSKDIWILGLLAGPPSELAQRMGRHFRILDWQRAEQHWASIQQEWLIL